MKIQSKQSFPFFLFAVACCLYFVSCSDSQNAIVSKTTSPVVLVQGSPIHGANGINFDQNDELYIASVISRTIFHLDKESGEIKHKYGTADSVQCPDDLTFGPEGSMYWTDILTGEVGKRTPDGVITKQFVAPGVNPITFSDDGRLFVALDFMGDALYEVDPNFETSPKLIAENIGWLNAMDWGQDGFLYGPVWSKGQVIKVNVDNGDIEVISDKLKIPAAVKFDSKGRLHVLDQKTGQVSRVNLATGELEEIASAVPGLDNLAFDSEDRLFIAHAQDGSVIEVLADGTIRDVVAGGIIAAGGLTMINNQNKESIILADLFSLREIDASDGSIARITRHFIGKPGLISPFTASSDADHIILTSWFGNEVQIWNYKENNSVEEYRDFAVPLNAISFQGNLIVAELGTKPGAARVVMHSDEGRTNLAGSEDGLAVPSGLASSKGNLWVADWATGKILQLIKEGEKLDSPITVATGLSNPEGLAANVNGDLFVVETGAGRVTQLIKDNDGDMMVKKTIANNLSIGMPAAPNTPPTWIFSGITVGSDGSVYVADDGGSKIMKINIY